MYRPALLVLVALAACGCESSPRALHDGPLSRASGKDNAGAADGSTAAYLAPGKTVTAEADTVFRVTDPGNALRSYWALLGSAKRPDGTTVPGVGGPSTTPGEFHLASGSAYLIGSMPWLTAEIVDISAEGTTILVDLIPASGTDPARARVMLVHNPTAKLVHVVDKAGNDTKLSAEGTYVDVTGPTASSAGSTGAATPFDPATSTRVGLRKQAAVAAGIPPQP